MVLREDPEHQEHHKLLMRVVRKYFGENLRDKFTSLHLEAERRRVAYTDIFNIKCLFLKIVTSTHTSHRYISYKNYRIIHMTLR